MDDCRLTLKNPLHPSARLWRSSSPRCRSTTGLRARACQDLAARTLQARVPGSLGAEPIRRGVHDDAVAIGLRG